MPVDVSNWSTRLLRRLLHPRAWMPLRAVLRPLLPRAWVLGLRQRLLNQRNRLALRYLRGDGLEIGALHRPQALPAGARVRYVDIRDRQRAEKSFPELDPVALVDVDIVDDGFTLTSIADGSQAFLIAHHVLEHSTDPIGVLECWLRVLEPGGFLLLSLPIASECFDRGRELTSLEHLLEDHRLYVEQRHAEIDARNRRHLVEWLTISEPRISALKRPGQRPATAEEIAARIATTNLRTLDIHFHTFSLESGRAFFQALGSLCRPTFSVRAFEPNGGEMVCVLQRSSGTNGA